MAKMKNKIPSLNAYIGRVWVEVTSILFFAMMCLTGIGVAISDLSKNLILSWKIIYIPNITKFCARFQCMDT